MDREQSIRHGAADRNGVDGIITDYPDRLRRAMSTKGLPLP
jgi:glycerophosphoryl diester phosphodiesterase